MKLHILEACKENNFELSSEDFDKFLTVIIISIINCRKSQRDYWSTKSILSCPAIQSLMPRNTFSKIKKELKLYKVNDRDEKDKVWKIRTLYSLFRQNITQFGFFDYNVSVDEVMVKYFGRFKIKQCIRNKPIRFGIKQWALCSNDGFLYDVDIYTGASRSEEDKYPLQSVCLGSRVVLKMLKKLFLSCSNENLQHYHVTFDNFFTSPDLMIHLERIGLRATGTVRPNRVKNKIEILKKSDRGTCSCVHDKNSSLNFITVMDSKPVSILSTKYGVEPKIPMQRYSDKVKKKKLFPQAFSVYNKTMGGVDLHDQHCNALMPCIRSKKWTWCLFMRLVQASLANATVLWNKLHPDETKASKDIVLEVSEYYIQSFSSRRTLKRQCTQSTSQLFDDDKDLSTGSHTIIEGILRKCNKSDCKTRTFRVCQNCRVNVCKVHETDHKNQ